jgi:hypothetical protein
MLQRLCSGNLMCVAICGKKAMHIGEIAGPLYDFITIYNKINLNVTLKG